MADPVRNAEPSHPRRSPSGVPHRWERLAAMCLKAEAEDSRIGDLSERHVRTRELVAAYLGSTPLAMTASLVAADLRYLFSAANVVLCCRAVDPAMRLSERGVRESIALYARERTMTLLHTAARKLAMPTLLLVASAFLVNSGVNIWSAWHETEALIVGLQREKAEAAAVQIDHYVATLQDQVASTGRARADAALPEQRRLDYLRLLRQVPVIVEVAELDAAGKEVLRVSRVARDTLDSGADFSTDARFTEALAKKKYVGPVFFDRHSEPNVSLALARTGPNSGVTLADVNIRRVWEVIDSVKVGKTGYAYVVDGNGRLIAGRDRALVLRQPDLSHLPQVQAASAAARSATPGDGVTFDTSLSGEPVVSVQAALPALGWTVFAELPVAEARAPLWSALIRAVSMLGLGVLAILLAGLAAARRAAPPRPARA